MKTRLMLLTLVIVVVGMAISPVNGKVIFFEDFAGDAGADLDGLAPGIDAVGGTTWIAAPQWNADGSVDGEIGSATLPFTPETGKIYQLTVRVVDVPTGDWIAVGFAQGSTSVNGARFIDDPYKGNPWALHRSVAASATDEDHYFMGPGTGDGAATGTWNNNVDMRIILDTRGDNWQVEFQQRYAGSTDPFTTVGTASYTSNPPIAAVGVANSKTFGSVEYLVLEEIGEGGATNPAPVNGATNVSTSMATLSWSAGTAENITAYHLYISADDPNLNGTPITVTDLEDPIEVDIPLVVEMDKTYFWRVDSIINDLPPTDANNLSGSFWIFESQKSVPTVTSNPVTTFVFPTETASFDVALTSLSTPTVSWYQLGDSDVLLATQTGAGSTVSGDYTVTITDQGDRLYSTILEVANIEDADQGEYYCVVSNSGGEDISLSARLVVNKLLAHYPFDDNPNDITGGEIGYPKNVVGANVVPTFSAGIIGDGAIELNGSQYIELSTDAYPKPGLGNGMLTGTIAAWVRVDQIASTETTAFIIGTHNSTDATAYQMWMTDGNPDDSVNFRIRKSAGDYDMPFVNGTASIIGDSQWHLVAATYEVGEGAQLYIDGIAVGAPDTYKAVTMTDWEYPVVLGGNNNRGTINGFLQGAMDDLQIYNYRLSKTEIADLYLAGFPDASLCILDYGSEFDVSGPLEDVPDCAVNLYDFAKFAAKWLDCGIYPDCQ